MIIIIVTIIVLTILAIAYIYFGYKCNKYFSKNLKMLEKINKNDQ